MEILTSDVIEEYLYHCRAKGYTEKTLVNKTYYLGHFCHYLEDKRGITKLDQLTVHDLKAYFIFNTNKGLKPTSIACIYRALHAFFSWLSNPKQDYIKKNLMDKIDCPKIPKTIVHAFSSKDVEKMIGCWHGKGFIDVRNKTMLCMLADCGLRAIELRRIKPSDIKKDMMNVLGKGNKERVVPLSPALKKQMIRYERVKKDYIKKTLDYPPQDFYFINYRGEQLTHTGVYSVIKEAGKRTGITNKRVSPHTFRHFFAVKSLESGIDLYSLSRLLGHSSINITERYLRSVQDTVVLKNGLSSSPLMNLRK